MLHISASGDKIQQSDDEYRQVWDSFNKLRQEGHLCDYTIKVGTKSFHVHRAIMAANSPYFRALFTNGMRESEQKEVEMLEIDEITMDSIIDFIYTRQAQLSMDTVLPVLAHANSFLIQSLVDHCCQFLISQLTPDNCIGILRLAKGYYLVDLINAASNYILTNFKTIYLKSSEFVTLEAEELIKFISSDELNLKTEKHAWKAITKWLNYQPGRSQYLSTLLRSVRLGLINYDYFVENIVSQKFFRRNKECQQIVKEAKHAIRRIHVNGDNDMDLQSWLFRPRIPKQVLFVIGGWCGNSPISFFESYDTRADRWYFQPQLQHSAPRAYHGMESINGLIYLIGGFDGTQYYNNMNAFNPATKEWKEMAPMYTQRCYVSTAVLNGQIYACGGYDGRFRLKSAEVYNPKFNQWTKIANMLSRRSDAAADSVLGKVYVAGGFDGDHCLITAERFDPQSNQWTLIREMVSARSGVSAVAYHNSLYVIGGFDGETRLTTVEMFNPINGHWVSVTPMYSPRSNCTAKVMDELIFVIGGFNGTATISNVECYDDSSNEWYDATHMTWNRSALRACVVSDLPNVKDYTYHGQTRNKGDSI